MDAAGTAGLIGFTVARHVGSRVERYSPPTHELSDIKKGRPVGDAAGPGTQRPGGFKKAESGNTAESKRTTGSKNTAGNKSTAEVRRSPNTATTNEHVQYYSKPLKPTHEMGQAKKGYAGKLHAKEPGGEHALHAAKKPETFGESNVVSRQIQKRNTQKQMMQRAQR
ncbi:MAG: hypothetical protein ILN61_08280 [Lachnospiraceae bacterium]|nr:hypothetical protein [Lachnospiraceae bacterium]